MASFGHPWAVIIAETGHFKSPQTLSAELVKMHDLLSPSKEHLEHGRCSPVGLPQPDLLHKGLWLVTEYR